MASITGGRMLTSPPTTDEIAKRRHAALRAASLAAFASPEFQSALADLKARCAAYAAEPRRPPARLSDEEFDAARDRDEGGPDIVRSIYA